MNDFSDHDLRDAYRSRNTSMANCLDFFSKFLAKLDYYLDKIEDIDVTSSEEKEPSKGEEEEEEEIEMYETKKRNGRNNKAKANRKFW